jgi:hypothetical protein
LASANAGIAAIISMNPRIATTVRQRDCAPHPPSYEESPYRLVLAVRSDQLRGGPDAASGACRVGVGEAVASADELYTAGLAGIGGIFEERGEGLREVGDPFAGSGGRSLAHGAAS